MPGGQDQLYLGISETLGKHGVSMGDSMFTDAKIYFLILAVIVCVVLLVGLLIDRKILKNKVLQALQASALNQIRGVTNKMPYSPFSQTITVRTSVAPVLPAPEFVTAVDDPNDPSTKITTWKLPALDRNGGPIQAMSELHVYAVKPGVIGALTDLFGMEPNAKVTISPTLAGQNISVPIGSLEFDTEYGFNARIKE